MHFHYLNTQVVNIPCLTYIIAFRKILFNTFFIFLTFCICVYLRNTFQKSRKMLLKDIFLYYQVWAILCFVGEKKEKKKNIV